MNDGPWTVLPAALATYWPCFRLSNGLVFDCQSSGEVTKMALFSFDKWPCFRLTKTIFFYDLLRNTGYLNLGTSKETSEFACDCFRNWWYNEGQYVYPRATSILALCDGGGSNNSRHYIFKEDLQKLADEIEVEVRIAHYPPYCSKYNPIEHRLFPHVTRACQGVVFTSTELVKELMEKTTTSKGLTVTVQIIDETYKTKRKVAEDFRENMPIVFDEYLPQWNYRAIPTQHRNAEVI